ncbi:hypothetical protein HLB44_24575 [Aquincola sp. S2]|uniref:Outer membrane lipoprotein-sorting protein n=1 Tax=Pseudaquabacterium terrae TaxID=2732868 RepID=A0ABX2ENE1_9BURK|nr:DUF6544 family protein [Aquabacterium terrae]NRF70187.1 hypothetical protein [Aquabacterium terrae]
MTLHPALRSTFCLMLTSTAAAAALAGAGQPAMRERIDREIDDLVQVARAAPAVDTRALQDLPAPVRRYLAYTGADRAPAARFARFRFEGEVRLPLLGSAKGVTRATPWMTTRGEQYMALSAEGLGYVWDSVWQQGPDISIDVRDLYARGDTHIWAVRNDGRVMVDERHDDINRTYMIRFFAEATQSPTMLLPGRHLRWEAVDEQRARAHVKDGALAASMVCSFAADGALTRCESDHRKLRFAGEVPERWVGARWVMNRGDYQAFGPLRVPTTMNVIWQLPEGDFEQVRAKTLAVDFDVAERYPATAPALAAK